MSNDESDAATGNQTDPDDRGKCFVIAPIGAPGSEIRKQADGLLAEAIRPVVEESLRLDVVAPHEIAEVGSITRQVIQHLLEADLVVADLTGLNPNVMYELAVRHASRKPVVPIGSRETSLPFDVSDERTIFYEDSMHGLNELKPKLEDAARAALKSEEPDNPIYRAQQHFQMQEIVSGDDEMAYLLDRLDEIESTVRKSIEWTAADRAIEALEEKNERLQKELEAKEKKLQEVKSRAAHFDEERRRERGPTPGHGAE